MFDPAWPAWVTEKTMPYFLKSSDWKLRPALAGGWTILGSQKRTPDGLGAKESITLYCWTKLSFLCA
jgi:hypothetical protein